ncbi:bifunctional pyr operon transcriptional regulator/uracil phosphoribosyltransferase PyrR [Candidatus Sumerlaeota bacterium]|nr:bifunctional pyr operon transcriptional regulator/uracil phosphoribosyltransferase PyrR [Candidatus Sumerlaeota bacterium]
MGQTIQSLSQQLIEHFQSADELVIIGIRTRGVHLAHRFQNLLSAHFGKEIPVGTLDITLYRDDLSQLASQPIVMPTELPFDVSGKKIILVDDVIFTGRTVRAAIDQLIDFGRPEVIRLAVIIDRGWREYPIQPDFVGKVVETLHNQIVLVHLKEIDGEDNVLLVSSEET